MVLAQTLQFGWFIGHLALLMATLRYFLSYITFNFASTWAMLSYRTVFVSAAFTYGIVVYKANKSRFRGGSSSRSPPQQTAVAILGDENMQYLLMALVWLLSKQIPLAILPFAVYSLFHVSPARS